MLQYLKPFHCANCNSMFSNRDSNRAQSFSRVPFILPCRHSICEHCLRTSLKHKTVVCSICKTSTDVAEGESAQSNYQPDVHALGILNVNLKHSIPSTKIKMVPSTNLQKNLKESFNRTEMACGNCKANQAQWQCDKCERNFCNACFDEVHVHLKKHEGKKIFAEVYNTMVQNGCPEHNNKDIEFYCELDNKLTCSFCMLIGSHVGHEVKTLVDKNKSCAEDLKRVLNEITEVQKRMKYTDHLLAEVIPTQKVDISKYIKNVHDHFHELHALLQLREAELISQLEDISQQNIQPIEKMKSEVSAYHKDLIAVKRDAEKVVENPYLAVSAPALLKKLEEFKTLPYYLVGITDNKDESLSIDITIDPEFDKKIKDLGKIIVALSPKFTLKAKDELPENYTYEMPEKFSAYDDSKSLATAESFSEDSLSVKSHKSSNNVGIQKSLKCREFTRNVPEEVFASHITSPSSFWMQKFSDRRKLHDLSEAINKWCKYEGKKHIVDAVEKGDLYIVQYSADKKWYRGRVKRVFEHEESPDSTDSYKLTKSNSTEILVKNRDPMVEVSYIDYGNSEIVPMSKFRHIQARFLNLPGMAKECSLIGIQPADGVDWSADALNTFKKFVEKKPLLMQTYEERNNVLLVDLSQKPDSSIAYDTPVSVRDALVFLEHAVFPAGVISPSKGSRLERKFLPPEQLRANSNICAILSHVNSPSYFYIQQLSTAPYLSSLIFDMNDAYNDEHASLFHGIYAPRVNMICAAQFTLDQQWYRAIVKNLPGGTNVEVQYVDFGNSEVVHYKRLRKLFDKFNKLNIQAIPCKLADIAPKGGKWTVEAVEWMTKNISKKQVQLKSLGLIPGENIANVVLYYTEGEFEICVNALMVEEGLAESTGPLSSCNARIRKKDSKAASQTFNNVRSPPVEAHDEKPGSSEIQPDKPKSYPSLVKKYPATDGKTMDVLVTHVSTPALFHIRIASDLEKKLTTLMDEMQKVYENNQYEVPECIIGKSYVVFSRSLRKWCRANIVSKLADDIFEVHLIDFGNKEQAAKKDIQKLLENFTQDESFALPCHLEGIIPAGGSAEWSQVACEAFQQLVAPHEKLLITTKGALEDGSLGVELFYEELVRGGALEPTKIEFRSITKELVNRGLALKIRLKNSSQSPSENNGVVIAKSLKSPEKKISHNEQNKPDGEKISKKLTFECCESESSATMVSSEKPSESKESVAIVGESLPCKVEDLVQDNDPIIEKPPKVRWLPRVIPKEQKFKAWVTNIGFDGGIQLHHIPAQGTSPISTILSALQYKYKCSVYEPPQEPLPKGEACIAKYSYDSQWYRAEIEDYSPGLVKVLFVDYGNFETISPTDIRTNLILQVIPRQCIECKLQGIELDYKGNHEVLSFLHVQLVEKYVEVEQLGEPDERGRIPCNIITDCGIGVAELLETMHFVKPSIPAITPPCPPTNVKQEDKRMCRKFKKATELQEGDIFPVCVSQINSPNIVYIQKLKISNPKSDVEKKRNEEHENFLQLIEDLQERAESFPPVSDPMPGMACCAKYSYDNNWYRCEVTNLGVEDVEVLYVDYGNSETIPVDNLRSPDDYFIEFPVQVHFCKIHGINPSEEESSAVKTFLVEKLMGENEVFAKVVVPGQISEVDLMLKDEEGQFKLIYEDLIKQNLS